MEFLAFLLRAKLPAGKAMNGISTMTLMRSLIAKEITSTATVILDSTLSLVRKPSGKTAK